MHPLSIFSQSIKHIYDKIKCQFKQKTYQNPQKKHIDCWLDFIAIIGRVFFKKYFMSFNQLLNEA